MNRYESLNCNLKEVVSGLGLSLDTAQFLADTQFWSFQEKGMYITAICVQHQSEYIPEEIMFKICQTPDPENKYPFMMKYFRKDKNGNYHHLYF